MLSKLIAGALAAAVATPVIAQTHVTPGQQPGGPNAPSGAAPAQPQPAPQAPVAQPQPPVAQPAAPAPLPLAQPQQPQQTPQPQAQAQPGASQQVVVNPAPSTALPPAPAPTTVSPAPAVTVNPPPAVTVNPAPATPVFVEGSERRAASALDGTRRRSPMATVATNALYGGLAGAVVGGGIALINEGDNVGRDLMLGTGLGVLAGAAVGGVIAYRDGGSDRVALDGFGTQQRDRARWPPARTVASWAMRW